MQFLEGDDHRRVISLLRLLGSNEPGERAAAAAALARIADERGFDWEEVVPSRHAYDEAVEAAIAEAVEAARAEVEADTPPKHPHDSNRNVAENRHGCAGWFIIGIILFALVRCMS
jgi:pyruvate/2-oxoglutarate dehydrogenase complex dihydrolipoamide acyltransferase (E2) component